MGSRALPLCVALAFVLTFRASADKLTADPNAAGGPSRPEAAATDARLDQNVTYQSGYKRVHDVASDLTTASGVYIASGSSRSDWQVRDIPLVVCADGVPLGRLLQTIADATHLSFRSTTDDDDAGSPTRRYRLLRPRKVTDEIASYADARRKADAADAQWVLDGLAALGKLPESARNELATAGHSRGLAMAFAAMAAALTPRDRAAIVSGDPVRLGIDRPDQSPAMNTVFRMLTETGAVTIRLENGGTVTGNSAAFALDSSSGELSMRTCIRADIDGAEGSGPMIVIDAGGLEGSILEASAVAGVELPARPGTQLVPKFDKDSPGPGYKPLKRDSDWDLPILKKELSIEQPKSPDQPTRADVIAALAKASGCTIICEDFESHKHPSIVTFPASGTTLAKGLKRIGSIDWFLDEKNNVIVGWAGDWRARHADLVPEKLITALRDKLAGPGVTLDDALQLLELTPGQYREWVILSRELSALREATFTGPGFGLWKLYATLTPDQKTMAMSETGLPLSAFDPDWLVGFLRDATESRPADTDPNRLMEALTSTESRESASAALSDPRRIGSYAMRVASKEIPAADDDSAVGPDAKPSARHPQAKLRSYCMELLGSADGDKGPVRLSGPRSHFPIFALSDP